MTSIAVLAEKPSQAKAYGMRSIYYMTGVRNKTFKRLWIKSLEVDELRTGFNNLQDNKKDLLLYYEAKTRQINDWLVGMNGSRLYILLLQQKGHNESLSIGRVQSYPSTL